MSTTTHTIPSGGIILWSGKVANIPQGWFLCNGSHGTPNLTDRFVIHADADNGGTNDVGDTTTGSAIHTHGVGSFNVSKNANIGHQTWGVAGRPAASYMSGDMAAPQVNSNLPLSGSSDGATVNHKPKSYALAYIMKS